MTMVYSGAISMGTTVAAVAGKNSSIKTEQALAATTNISLRSLSSTAGKLQPDAMSEFYGYTYTAPKGISATNVWSIGYTGSISGNITITGSSYTFFAQAITYGVGNISTTITVGGQSRSVTSTSGTVNSTTSFVLGVGTYAYTLSVTVASGSGSGGINAV